MLNLTVSEIGVERVQISAAGFEEEARLLNLYRRISWVVELLHDAAIASQDSRMNDFHGDGGQ